MNRIIATTLIAASAALAGHVFADDITPSEPFVSAASRAEVQAGVTRAGATANPWSIAYKPLAAFESSRSRAEVQAEYIASRHEVAALTAEDSGSLALAKQQQQVNAQVANVRTDAASE